MGSESEPNFSLVFHSRSDNRPCSWTLRGEALREGIRYQSFLPSDPSTFASASSPWALPLCQNAPGRKPQGKPPCGFRNGSATTQSKERGRASHFGLFHKQPSSTPQCAGQPLGKPLGLILCTSPARTVCDSVSSQKTGSYSETILGSQTSIKFQELKVCGRVVCESVCLWICKN